MHWTGIWTADERQWFAGTEVAEPGGWFPTAEWSTDEGTCSGDYVVLVFLYCFRCYFIDKNYAYFMT